MERYTDVKDELEFGRMLTESETDSDLSDLEELEIALYGQIHHEYNNSGYLNLDHTFEIEEKNNSETFKGNEIKCDDELPCNIIDKGIEVGRGKSVSRETILSSEQFISLCSSDDEENKDAIELSKFLIKSNTEKGASHSSHKEAKCVTRKSPLIQQPNSLSKEAVPKNIHSLKQSSNVTVVISSSDSEESSLDFFDADEWKILDSVGDQDDILLPNVKSNLVLDCDELNIEETSLESIHSRMPDTGWHVIDKDKFVNMEMRNRYYTAFNVRCHNCDEKGHLSKCCPLPQKLPTCCLCSERGHTYRTCPNSLCYNCNQPGHDARDCTSMRRSHRDECYRCGFYGHMKNECPDLWRQYHVTTKGNGKELKKLPKRENKTVYCFNCAKKGHFGHECDELFMDKFRNPVTPFIARYEIYKPRQGTKRKFDDEDNDNFRASKKTRYGQESYGHYNNYTNQIQSRSKEKDSSYRKGKSNKNFIEDFPRGNGNNKMSQQNYSKFNNVRTSKVKDRHDKQKAWMKKQNSQPVDDFCKTPKQNLSKLKERRKKQKIEKQRNQAVDDTTWWNKPKQKKKKNKSLKQSENIHKNQKHFKRRSNLNHLGYNTGTSSRGFRFKQ